MEKRAAEMDDGKSESPMAEYARLRQASRPFCEAGSFCIATGVMRTLWRMRWGFPAVLRLLGRVCLTA